jgi:hypothetical protein
MYLKSIVMAGALLAAVPALAQQAAQQERPNFILGHGFLQPAHPQSSDYPPGHSVATVSASRLDEARPERTAPSRTGTDVSPTTAPAKP